MRRRETLRGAAVRLVGQILVAVALLSLAVPAVAQDKVWRVGLLSNGAPTASPEQQSTWRSELLLSLDQNGYRLGRNLELVDRYSDGHVDRLPGLAGEIAAAGVDVVVAVSDPSVRAMLAVTQATPIVIGLAQPPADTGACAGDGGEAPGPIADQHRSAVLGPNGESSAVCSRGNGITPTCARTSAPLWATR